jgi:hypothetical protein
MSQRIIAVLREVAFLQDIDELNNPGDVSDLYSTKEEFRSYSSPQAFETKRSAFLVRIDPTSSLFNSCPNWRK